ncbi:MAG: hypothetical protein FWD68_13795 [Alphaproteobacteria bacterium]|nr:hypothetical protein [Alphaproteobacteria bacterium]
MQLLFQVCSNALAIGEIVDPKASWCSRMPVTQAGADGLQIARVGMVMSHVAAQKCIAGATVASAQGQPGRHLKPRPQAACPQAASTGRGACETRMFFCKTGEKSIRQKMHQDRGAATAIPDRLIHQSGPRDLIAVTKVCQFAQRPDRGEVPGEGTDTSWGAGRHAVRRWTVHLSGLLVRQKNAPDSCNISHSPGGSVAGYLSIGGFVESFGCSFRTAFNAWQHCRFPTPKMPC